MEFETLKKSHLKRNIIIGVVAVLIISAAVLTFTRAKYLVTESIPLVNGTINYVPYDFKIIAMYQKDDMDGEYVEITEMPTGGFLINEENSYCTLDNVNKDNEAVLYTNALGEHVISGLKKNSKCYLYFDPSNLLIDIIKGENSQSYLAYDDTADSNLRYVGSNPNNYIYFNCDNYLNQSDSTCELWRIIGIFNYNTHGQVDELVKIVRDNSIGTYPWDYTGAIGFNAWNTSQLQDMLNTAYYNSLSGSYFEGTYEVDFTNTGLKNTDTKKMIENVTWKMGATSSEITSLQYYNAERKGGEWEGIVGLIYPSDYLYSFDSNSSSWMTKYAPGSYSVSWSITSSSSSDMSAFGISENRGVITREVYNSADVLPTLYLNPDLIVINGDGSIDNPYQLSVE